MKQTAVEWLVEQMPTAFKNLTINKKIIQQAKEMEKKQIMEAHIESGARLEDISIEAAENYYKKTYGGNK